MDMLRITDLHKRFGDKEVLRGLNLTVPEHSIYGFIGKNGAGKTTTMKTILGLLKADSGEIIVGGERVVYGQTSTNQYIGYLATGLINIINIFQPDVLCIGGGIAGQGENLLGPLRTIIEKERFTKYNDKQTKVCIASLGNDAGIIGAACL